MRVLAGYEPRRDERHALWRRIAERRARTVRWHGVGWALERHFGARRDSARSTR
jgi:hypothetical protein